MSNDEKLPHKGKIIAVSIIVPVVVAALFGLPKIHGYNTSFLPPIYATINGITACLLIAALIAVKKKNIKVHQKLIQTAILCSLLFLVGYIIYHVTAYESKYGDLNGDGELNVQEALGVASTRMVYLVLLLLHIVLSVVVIPFVLFTYVRGKAGHIKKHRKLAKITFPIWLFVAISGVVVYLFIAPYQEARRIHMETQHPIENNE